MKWPSARKLYRDERTLLYRIKVEFTYKDHAQQAKDDSIDFVDK